MVRVRLRSSIVKAFHPGDEFECSVEEAERLISRGTAERIESPESNKVDVVETQQIESPGKRRRKDKKHGRSTRT